MKRISTGLLVALGLSLAAASCASTPSAPPRELVDARAAFQQAAASPAAAARAQPEMADAKQALDRAEKAFADDPGAASTRDYAYVAERKAESARAKGNALSALEDLRVARTELASLRNQQQAMQRGELSKTREQLEKERAALMSERQARAAAENKTKEALEKLQGMTAAQTDRGLVLTLSGGLLFASGSSTLLPAAQHKLTQVAKTIAEDRRPITVVGHTDATGSDDANQKLAEKRAESVRSYLVAHGVADSRITAEGAGETQPIADNSTAEGRAMNRRVEIILANVPERAR